MQFNKSKFRGLILYFANESKEDPYFGAVKLNKLLFYADFLAYGYLGRSITDATYIHLPKGPGPSELLWVRNEMEKDGKLKVERVYRLNNLQHRPIALEQPDLSLFTKEELEICKEALRLVANCNSEETSDRSHNWLGWIYTNNKETIPYQTIFVRNREPITLSDISWASQMIAEGKA